MYSNDNVVNVTMERICRTCMLEAEEYKSLFKLIKSADTTLAFSEMLMACASVQIKLGDGLPENICVQCAEELCQAFKFKQRTETIDSKLRKYVEDSEIKQLQKGSDQILETNESDCDSLTSNSESSEPVARRVIRNNSPKKLRSFQNTKGKKLCQCSSKSLPLRKRSTENKHCCKIYKKDFVEASLANSRTKTYKIEDADSCGEVSEDCLNRDTEDPVKQSEYKCSECDKTFTSGSGLRYHKNTHSGTRNFECDVCKKKFICHANLVVHKRRHLGDFSYLCSECGRKFLTKGELSRHARRHRNEKPFPCDLCDKCFTTNVGLQQHKMRHSGEKPFLCYVCSKRFTTSANLREHLISHTGQKPHMCNICNKGCVSTSDLRTHLRIHSGEKPYLCPVCPKAFARSGSLKVHSRTHTGDKPYECGLCKKRFGHTGSLSKHLTKHLGPE